MNEQEKNAISVLELALWTLWKRVCTGLEQNKCSCTAFKKHCQDNQPPLTGTSAGLNKSWNPPHQSVAKAVANAPIRKHTAKGTPKFT